MSNSIPIKWMIWKKWINSQKGSLSSLNQEGIETINKSVISTEIETMIKNLPISKSPGSDDFIRECYQTFREELTPILLKLLQKFAKERKLPNLFYEATITLITKQDKDTKKLQVNITDKLRCKNQTKNSRNPDPTIL